MKKLYKYTLLLMAAFLFVPLAAFGQSAEDVIGLNKTVTGPNDDGSYTITLETFVTGGSVTTVTDINVPCDIVLVLDYSNSMTANNITTYTKGTEITSGNTTLNYNNTYIITIDGTDYYMRGYSQGGWSGNYYWYYNAENPPSDGTQISGITGQSTTVTAIKNATGATAIYNTITSTQTRLAVMKTAAQEFVETVYANNPTSGDKHKIGVVWFNKSAGRDVELTELTSQAVVTDIKNTISNATHSDSNTRSDLAMQEAYNMLKDETGRQLVTVFFTDGEPATQRNTFSASTARAAVAYADTLKALSTTYTYYDSSAGENKTLNLASKVYSVAVLDSETSNNNDGTNSQAQYDIRRFLHYVSSNYTTGITSDTSYNFNVNYSGATPAGGDEAPHDYYQLSDGSNLTSIFRSIASSASSGGSSYSLSTTSVVTVDIVSSYFMLPEGADADDIKVYTAPFASYTSKDDKSTYVFGTKTEYDGATVSVGKNTAGQDTIGVTNFNFADNWCGYNEVTSGGSTTYQPHGNKLIIEIPIVVDVQNPGGTSLQTNAPGSGIYVDGECLISFSQPTVNLPNIIIRKYGLVYQNEGASFKLEKLNDAGTAVDTSVEPYYIVITASDNDPNTFDFVQVKLNEVGRYRVTETDWGWNYTRTADISALEEDDSKDTNRTLIPKASGTNTNSQPYIDRDVSGDTEQTITLSGGNKITGTVYDFRNAIKSTEHRNYNEAHVTNIFPTVTQKTTVSD